MKTTYIVILVLLAACLGLWYSIDVLSNTTILIEKNGELFKDSYTTTERFFALWPVSIIGGLIFVVVISVSVLITFEASENSEIKELKAKLEYKISRYESLKEQCLSDVEKARKLANTAMQDAATEAKREVECELADIKTEKLRISKAKTELNNFEQKLKNKSAEIKKTLTENNELVEHYKQEVKLAKQKAKNHGNALSRKNNILNKLKTNAEYLDSFIEENYET